VTETPRFTGLQGYFQQELSRNELSVTFNSGRVVFYSERRKH